MKKTETNVSSVRGHVDTSKSIVKIKRHTILSQPSSVTRVTFNIPDKSGSKKLLSLPSNIPDDQLEELENDSMPKPDSNDKAPKKVRPRKKKVFPPKRSANSKTQEIFESSDPDAKDMCRIVREFMAVEDRLDKLQSSLSTNCNQRMPNLDQMTNNIISLPIKEPSSQIPHKMEDDNTNDLSSPPYNAADYIHEESLVTKKVNEIAHNSGSSRGLVLPKSENIPIVQAPINFDIKSVISAIRKDLDEWRQANVLFSEHSPNPSSSIKKTSVYSADLSTPKSEVSRDIPEKDISCSSESSF